MARIRTVKPSFWKNEDLALLPAFARLLFIGLWNLADCEGRLEDRPRRIKAEILPYDDVNVDFLLDQLAESKFIIRYLDREERSVIQVINFKKHQRITGKEAADESAFSAPENQGNSGETTGKHSRKLGNDKNFTTFEENFPQSLSTSKAGYPHPPEIRDDFLHPLQRIDFYGVYTWETLVKHWGSNWETTGTTGKEYITLPIGNTKGGKGNKEDIREKNNSSTAKSHSKKKSIVQSPDEVATGKAEFAWNKTQCAFSSVFREKWIQLAKVPKWRVKAELTFVIALQKLMTFEEEFAIALVEASTINNWQGVIFPETQEKYENWKHNKTRNNGQRNQQRQQQQNGGPSNTSNGLGGANSKSAIAKISYLAGGSGLGGGIGSCPGETSADGPNI